MTRYVVTCDMENGNTEILDKTTQEKVTIVGAEAVEPVFVKGEGDAHTAKVTITFSNAAVSIEPQREPAQ